MVYVQKRYMCIFFTQNKENGIEVVCQFENEIAVTHVGCIHCHWIGVIIAELTSKTVICIGQKYVVRNLKFKPTNNQYQNERNRIENRFGVRS